MNGLLYRLCFFFFFLLGKFHRMKFLLLLNEYESDCIGFISI